MNDEKVKQSVGRGRPKGAVDTVVRKKRSDRELMVSEGDNAKITLHNMELMKAPRINTANRSEVEERMWWYFEKCITDDMKPSVAGLCLALGISRQAWQTWGTGEHRDYADLVEKARQVMASIMEDYMLHGKINPVTGIFLMKNNLGYSDKSEMVITPHNPLGETTDMEALGRKYLDNAAICDDIDGEYPAIEDMNK